MNDKLPKNVTRRELILIYLAAPGSQMTCQQICYRIIKDQNIDPQSSVANYLSGSISSILAKMVKDGILEYVPEQTGPNGGHIYRKRIPTHWTND